MLDARVVDDVHLLEGAAARWDELAVRLGRPYCLPAWMLAWWRKVAPEGARLRVVVVEDGETLVGIAPLFVSRGPGGVESYRFLGRETSMGLEPLLDPERASEALPVLVGAVAELEPRPVLIAFEGIDVASAWPERFCAVLPGGAPWTHRDDQMPAPFVRMDPEGYEAWLGKKSSNFRQQMRRSKRQLEQSGAVFRRSTPADAERDLQTFARLHLDRWRDRGGSVALRAGVVDMLQEVAATEIVTGRMRIFNVDLAGETISTQIFMCAGTEYAYWLGGFDDAHSSQRPGLLAILSGVEDAHEGGFERVDLGPGDDSYKYRLTDEEEELVWLTLVSRGDGYLGRRARLAPHLTRVALRNRLSDEMKLRINKLLRRA